MTFNPRTCANSVMRASVMPSARMLLRRITGEVFERETASDRRSPLALAGFLLVRARTNHVKPAASVNTSINARAARAAILRVGASGRTTWAARE